MNKLIITGNIGQDPTFKYTPQGKAVLNFSVAVNKKWTVKVGDKVEKKEKTTWFKVALWEQYAETMSQYLQKGMKVLVEGEAEVEVYTDKNGKPAASLVIGGNRVNVEMLDRKGDGNGESQGRPAESESGEDYAF